MSEIPMYPDQCEHGASRPDVCGHCRLAALQARHDLVAKREGELHYAIRREANILDKRLSEDEAHAEALFRVAKMHDVVEAAHEVNRQMKATNGKVTIGAWAKLADALDMRVPTSERTSAAVVAEDPQPLRPREG